MSHFHHNRLYDSRRRRRYSAHSPRSPGVFDAASRLVTTAAMAYGAYRLGSWAWNSYFADPSMGGDVDKSFEEEEDDLYEWSEDMDSRGHKELFDHDEEGDEDDDGEEEHEEDNLFQDPLSSPNIDEAKKKRASRSRTRKIAKSKGEDAKAPHCQSTRSRRSRIDWSKQNRGQRSHRPSPAQHHHHHRMPQDPQHWGMESGRRRSAQQAEAIERKDGMHIDLDVMEMRKGALMGMEGGNSSNAWMTVMGVAASTTSPLVSSFAAGTSPTPISAASPQVVAAANNTPAGPNRGISRFVRNARVARCRMETSRAVMNFLPNLKRAVMKETDVSKEAEELKKLRVKRKELTEKESNENGEEEVNGGLGNNEEDSIRDRERHLWNIIKNKSITRLVTTAYAHAIFFLILTVQVNLLGGRLLRDEHVEQMSSEQQTSNQSEAPKSPPTDKPSGDVPLSPISPSQKSVGRYRSTHQTILVQTYQHFFSKGIPSLTEVVETAVEKVVENWDVSAALFTNEETDPSNTNGGNTHDALKDNASLEDVSLWMERIRDAVERRRRASAPSLSQSRRSPFIRFIIPPEGGDNGQNVTADINVTNDASETDTEPVDEELVRYILDETYDLLESPTYGNAERACLDATFAQLREDGYAKLFPSPSSLDKPDDTYLMQNGTTAMDGTSVDDMNGEGRKPLVTVVTHLQKAAVGTFHRPPSHREEMASWGGVLGMMEEPLPSGPNVYIPKLERLGDVLELGDVCFN